MRPARLATVFPQLGLHPALGCLVPKLQAQSFINPIGPFHVNLPAFTAKQDMHPPVAVAHTRLADLLDASCKPSLVAAAALRALWQMADAQAATLAYADAFRAIAFAFVVALCLTPWLRQVGTQPVASTGH